jgi:hypothetical protein
MTNGNGKWTAIILAAVLSALFTSAGMWLSMGRNVVTKTEMTDAVTKAVTAGLSDYPKRLEVERMIAIQSPYVADKQALADFRASIADQMAAVRTSISQVSDKIDRVNAQVIRSNTLLEQHMHEPGR